MTDLLIINEDARRKLTAFPEGKMLEIKEDCEVGNHYHKIKTEYFILCKGGYCELYFNHSSTFVRMIPGLIYMVAPGVYHTFKIKAGSFLIGLCSHPYDPKDDYHL